MHQLRACVFLANSLDIHGRHVLSNATSHLANKEQLELVNEMSHKESQSCRDTKYLWSSSQHVTNHLLKKVQKTN